MNLFLRIGICVLGLLAILYGAGLIFANGSTLPGCRRGCALEHLVLILFGDRDGKVVLGAGTILIGVTLIWQGIRSESEKQGSPND